MYKKERRQRPVLLFYDIHKFHRHSRSFAFVTMLKASTLSSSKELTLHFKGSRACTRVLPVCAHFPPIGSRVLSPSLSLPSQLLYVVQRHGFVFPTWSNTSWSGVVWHAPPHTSPISPALSSHSTLPLDHVVFLIYLFIYLFIYSSQV